MSQQRQRRGWLVAVLLLLAGLALAGAALPWLLARWLDRTVRTELAAWGIDAVRIGAIRVGPGATVVEDLVLGDAELVAQRIRVAYGPGDLLRGRVGTLALEGVRARARLGDASVGVVERLLGGALGAPGEDASGEGGAPPWRGLVISDLHARLETPAAAIHVAIEGRLERPDTRWRGELRARVRSEPDRLHGTAVLAARAEDATVGLALSGEDLDLGAVALESLALELDGRLTDARLEAAVDLEASAQTALGPVALSLPARLDLDTAARRLVLRARELPSANGREPERSRLRLPALDLELVGLSGELALAGEGPQAALRVAGLRDLRDPARFAPLALDATLVAQDGQVRGRGTFTGTRAPFVVRFDALHDHAAAAGRARLDLLPIEFETDGLQPGDLSPLLARLEATRGHLDAEGELVWGDALRSDLVLTLRDWTGRVGGVELEGLDTQLRVTRPWPLATPAGQQLEVERVRLGLDVEQLATRFALQPPGVLDVASAQARVLGGTLRTRGRFDPGLPRNAFVVDVASVDLAALAERLRLEGLSIDGSLSGRVPLAWEEGAVHIEQAELAATGGGVLRYRPPPGTPLPRDDPRVAVLLDALGGFHYEQLRITIDGALAGDLEVGLLLAGSNPDFYEGRAVEFNLDLEAPVSALLRDLDLEAFPERILRRLRQREALPDRPGEPR